MWRTFPRFPAGVLSNSCIVRPRAVFRSAVLRLQNAGGDGPRNESSAQWVTLGPLLFALLLWGNIGTAQQPHLHAVTYHDPVPGKYQINIVDFSPERLLRGSKGSFRYSPGQSALTHAITVLTCLVAIVFLYRFRMLHLTRQLNLRFQERLAERTRIARDLHDTLLQSFQGLMLRFQIANETILSDPHNARELLEQALERADLALAESRKAIQGIRSDSFSGRDLANSLKTTVNGLLGELALGKAPPPASSVIAEGQPRVVSALIAEDVCRIAREAYWNAFSHARARRIETEVAFSNKFLRLRIRDDGIGIDSEILRRGGRGGHWGMTGMYERAKAIHGRLSIWSKQDAGTEVELRIPASIAYESSRSHTWFRRSPREEHTCYGEEL